MKFAPLFLLMLAFVVADKVRPDPKECPQGKVFDKGSEQCRNCGLCCLEHEHQKGCLEQDFDWRHSCFYDASCQDETNLRPAAKVKTWDLQKILPIGVCGGVVALALVIAGPLLLVKLVKKLWDRGRPHGTDRDTNPLLRDEGSEASHSAETEGARNQKTEDPKEPSDPGSSLQGASIATPRTQHGISPGPSSHLPSNHQAGEDQDQTTAMKLVASPPSSSGLPEGYSSPPIVNLREDV